MDSTPILVRIASTVLHLQLTQAEVERLNSVGSHVCTAYNNLGPEAVANKVFLHDHILSKVRARWESFGVSKHSGNHARATKELQSSIRFLCAAVMRNLAQQHVVTQVELSCHCRDSRPRV